MSADLAAQVRVDREQLHTLLDTFGPLIDRASGVPSSIDIAALATVLHSF